MKRFVTYLLPAALMLGLAFQAWGLPQPEVLVIPNSGSSGFTVKGDFREMAPVIGAPKKSLTNTEGLKDCALLGDSPVLEQCDQLNQVPIREFLSDSIVLEFDPDSQIGWDKAFLFILDGEGHGHPIGPLELDNWDETGGTSSFSLVLENYHAEDASPVQVWKPVSESPEKGDFEAPGQPGQPKTN